MDIKCYRDTLVLKYWHVLGASSGSKGETLWLWNLAFKTPCFCGRFGVCRGQEGCQSALQCRAEAQQAEANQLVLVAEGLAL